MPTKPKPATVKPSAPKTAPSLYKAIRAILEAKDRETLHARTTKAVEAVEAVIFGNVIVDKHFGPMATREEAQKIAVTLGGRLPTMEELRGCISPEPEANWSLDGLVVDPGEEAVGQWGFFWDNGDDTLDRVGICESKTDSRYTEGIENLDWDHFAYIPNFPGAELLKRTTGYEAGK